LRILFVLEYYYPHLGGAETLFQQLCEGLVNRGHEVSVVTSKLWNSSGSVVLNGVQVYRVPTPELGKRYWFTFNAIPYSAWYARKADVISTTTYNGALPAWIASKMYKKPCLITVHEVLGESWADFQGMNILIARLHQLLEWAIIKLNFDKYVGVSSFTKEAIEAYGKNAIAIHNGIDYGLFNPERYNGNRVRYEHKLDNCFVYMYYGRPGLTKGVEDLIKASVSIARSIPKSRLMLLLGKEPKAGYESVLNLIHSIGIDNHIVIIDPVPRAELPEYIAASDCVVIPSLSEGFGFSAAEACAMNKPVVVSNVASLPEVVSGDYVFCKPNNPDSIVQAVSRVYYKTMGKAEPRRFTWDDCVDKYETLYKEMVR